MMAEDMASKKLRGSGGFAIARITDQEQKKANLGGPELFLAGIGRLEEDRFEKYYCNKCEKEYDGSPAITYDNPNEDIGEGVILVEKGEYRCKTCSSTIAQYRKFDMTSPQPQSSEQFNVLESPPSSEVTAAQPSPDTKQAISGSEGVVPIQSLIGMAAYDSEAMQLGKVESVGLRKQSGGSQIMIKVGGIDMTWDSISKIGDIILIKSNSPIGSSTQRPEQDKLQQVGGKCPSCGFQNDPGSLYCSDCGARI